MAVGEEVRAVPTSYRTKRSEDTVTVAIERNETFSTPEVARMEDCEIDDWHKMINKELLDRRVR